MRVATPKLLSVSPARLFEGHNQRVEIEGTNLRPFMRASFNTEQVRNNFSPTALFRGMEKDLAALCVTSTNNPR